MRIKKLNKSKLGRIYGILYDIIIIIQIQNIPNKKHCLRLEYIWYRPTSQR